MLYCFMLWLSVSAPDLALVKNLRTAFFEVVENDGSTYALKSLAMKNTEDPVCLGYMGASQCLSARETWSPAAKLSRFTEGKELLERAIRQHPESPDLIFLRYSIQSSAPGFLNYNNDIASDRAFLLKTLEKLEDDWYRRKIAAFLKKN